MERKTHSAPKPGRHPSAIELARVFGGIADYAERALNGDFNSNIDFQLAIQDSHLIPAEIKARSSHLKNRLAVRQIELGALMRRPFSDRVRSELIVASAHKNRGRRS